MFNFTITDTLSKNALRSNIQKTLDEARGCICDTRATQAKRLSLQNNINRLCRSLNEIDTETLANLEPKKIETQKLIVSESMNVLESVHEILV